MATKKSFKRQYKKHLIVWSEKERRYIIKTMKGKRIYDTDTESSAEGWIKRNTK
jgi:hypothetical protein